MGKLLELPDEVYAAIEHEARRRHMEPAEFLRQMVEPTREMDWVDFLRSKGRTGSRPRQGLCKRHRFPLIKTKDGSPVSQVIIQERR